ncbi:unnamed protein product [Spirodela intermedia]|uniref:Uncharacterized protein n=1 Tax=Spirodela intermedia TaxID=51605 RepID=A0A7I8ITI8_SPIIN|nr:unnamed protein product [Spirodela intermedia]CAA6660865.1 unnamed protein product [Spirodela intermedia]
MGVIRSHVVRKWRIKSSVLLDLLHEGTHMALSNDVPYIVPQTRGNRIVSMLACCPKLKDMDDGAKVGKSTYESFKDLNLVGLVTQDIVNHVVLSLLVPNDECIIFKLLAEKLYEVAILAKDTPDLDARCIIVLYEAVIECCQANEAPSIMHVGWSRAKDDGVDLF